MKDFLSRYISGDSLHHAYCIECQPDKGASELLEFLERELSFNVRGNPDFWHGQFETFGIEEGRVLKAKELGRSFSGGKKVFVISAWSITREAENSLLKMFEEPTKDSHFFLLIPSADKLSLTLLSRLFVIKPNLKETKPNEGDSFLSMDLPNRLEYAGGLAKAIADGKKRKNEALVFLESLIRVFKDSCENPLNPNEASACERLLRSCEYLQDSSSSVKIILEDIALTLPFRKSS